MSDKTPKTAADWDRLADANARLAREERLGEIAALHRQAQAYCREHADRLREGGR